MKDLDDEDKCTVLRARVQVHINLSHVVAMVCVCILELASSRQSMVVDSLDRPVLQVLVGVQCPFRRVLISPRHYILLV